MDDPFDAIIPECTIPPDMETALLRAPEIGEPCFCPLICTPNEIHRLPDTPTNPPAKDHSRPPGLSPADLAALINFLSKNSDRSLGNHDILEIAERKGLPFPPPKWWRPGGYDRR